MSDKQTFKANLDRNMLANRSQFLYDVRKFFYDRCILEVDTPILSHYAVTDEHLDSFSTTYFNKDTLYLNTSPEYHMKRLLASQSGAIFQISKVFRNEGYGDKHNPEFTMLEWYRPGFTLQRLLDEVEDLLKTFFSFDTMTRHSYEYIFETYLGYSPLTITRDKLIELCKKEIDGFEAEDYDNDTLIMQLFSSKVEPYLGLEAPVAIYNYPATQAALAMINPEDPRTAQRAEVYYKGIELANGFFELTDYEQQYERFKSDNAKRILLGKEPIEIDVKFLEALKSGELPSCSGIALGLDRLMMIYFDKKKISDVIAFDITNS